MKKRTVISLVIICIAAVICFGGAYISINGLPDSLKPRVYTAEQIAQLNMSNTQIKQESEEVEPEAVSTPTGFLFTGDIELSDYVLSNYRSKGIDGVLSSDMQKMFTDADYVAVNNEFCYSTRGEPAPDKQFTFRVDPKYVSVLSDMSVDLATLANNHVLDYGHDALTDTFTTLSDAGIEYTGAGDSVSDASKLITFEKDGKTYGFLAASRVIPVAGWNVENSQPGVFACYDTTRLISAIEDAKQNCDYVIVFVHWGVEHTDELTDYQKSMGHAFIDAGADCVVGSHPHVVQGIENYGGGKIFYSLGNFIFNQTIERTFALSVTQQDDGLSYSIIPAKALNGTTQFMSDDEAHNLYEYLNSISTGSSVSEDGTVE